MFKYETPKLERDDNADDDYVDDDNIEEEAQAYGRENVGSVASPYLMHSVYKRRFLDIQYGIRKDGDIYMIGDSPIVVVTDGDITIKGIVFKGSKGIWELLKSKNVNMEFITKDDLKTYKKILMMTNAILTTYQADGNINITRGKKFRKVIAPLYAKPKE